MFKTTITYSGFWLTALLGACLACTQCNPPKTTTHTPQRPLTPRPQQPTAPPTLPPQIDTVQWAEGEPTEVPEIRRSVEGPYHIALVLPFLTNQFDVEVPAKSTLSLQFYGGARLAAEELSRQGGRELKFDVVDSQLSDAEFSSALQNPLLQNAQVIIGPIRSSHVTLLGPQAKSLRQIVVSPKSPGSNLVSGYPDFIQTNPSLQAHCKAIVEHALKRYKPEQITLVCKQSEANRLPYFQDRMTGAAKPPFNEIILPDDKNNLSAADLKSSIKSGQTNVFMVPSWSSQTFVNSMLRELHALEEDVVVYGMPQWAEYENILPEFLSDNNVHIAKADYIDYNRPEVKRFQQLFYERYGTIPDEDAFIGYDVTLFTGQMLRQYGLSMAEKLDDITFTGLRSSFIFDPVYKTENILDDPQPVIEYQENTFVHILKFDRFGYVPD